MEGEVFVEQSPFAALLVMLGVSALCNIGLVAAIIFVVRQNRDVSIKAMAMTQEASDSILAVADLPAAAYRQSVRDKALETVSKEPVERIRKILN